LQSIQVSFCFFKQFFQNTSDYLKNLNLCIKYSAFVQFGMGQKNKTNEETTGFLLLEI